MYRRVVKVISLGTEILVSILLLNPISSRNWKLLCHLFTVLISLLDMETKLPPSANQNVKDGTILSNLTGGDSAEWAVSRQMKMFAVACRYQ